MKEKEWRELLRIPGYLVQGIGDAGVYERYQDGARVDFGDLRIALELSGGDKIVLPPGARLLMLAENEDDDVLIEVLRDVERG